MGKFKKWLGKVIQDRYLHYHKSSNCPMYDHTITIICNSQGKRYSECLTKYCPFCGEKLKG